MTSQLPATDRGQTVRTVTLDGLTEELLRLLPETGGLAWVRDGLGLVGWGAAAQFHTSGPERFSRAQRWWKRWCEQAHVEDQVRVPGTGPVAFASFTFDAGPQSSVIIVPSVVIGRRDGRAWLTTVAGAQSAGEVEPPIRCAPSGGRGVQWEGGTVPLDRWARAVSHAVERITAGELDKVVLARDLLARLPQRVDEPVLLQRLAQAYPQCWTFSVAGLLGSTPELLVRRRGDRVTSRVLAGTVRRHGDDSDDGLAEALLDSGKDLQEHEYAVGSVAEALAAHCTDLDVPTQPHVLRLSNVQHLATDVTGMLADGAPVLALAASLHPTAAVCGTPTERAAHMIREVEGMDRGRYAGPVGWLDSSGDGEFGIALRCAAIESGPHGPGTQLRLYAGCGIVAGSTPEAEIAESEAKLDAVRDALSQVP